MKFVLQMAVRELRSSWQRLLFFFLCIAIGVCAIVALRSITQNVNRAVAGEARALLTADVMVDSNRPWADDTLAIINQIAKSGLVTARVETIESATMARPADEAKEGAMMIELKGIEAPFPLYGEIKLANDQAFDHTLIANHGAVVTQQLLDRLQLQVGDRIKIGTKDFEIRAVLIQEPGGTGGFRLGPRVFIEREALEGAGLTGFGSRARRKILLATPDGQMETLTKLLRAELKNHLVNIRSYKDSQENLNDQIARAENYLSLTGLIILVLGGLGISNVTRVFIEQKKKSIAVLKCLGGTGGRITAVYLVQILTLGLAGSLLGVLMAKITLMVTAYYFADSLPPNLEYTLDWRAISQGLGVGMLICILFSVLPLLRVRNIKPNVLLRDDETVPGRRIDYVRWGIGGLVIIGVLLVVSWQAGSLKVGSIFLAGLAVTAGLLQLAAGLLIWLVRRVRGVTSFALKQAITSLYRPGNQTRVVVTVVGLGVFLIIATRSIQSNLMNEFDFGRRGKLPNFFLIDVQRDQEQGLSELIKRETGEEIQLIPTIRARIVAINDKEVDFDQQEMRRDRGRLGREYVVTYRPNLDDNERVIAGEFWNSEPSSAPEISIEESMRGLAGLDLGSAITFDIQGRKVTATVSSIRYVDWRNSRTGFMILFRPGALDNAPQMMIGTLNGPTEEAARSQFQRVLLDQYPNISLIDVTDIVANVKRIIDNVTLAISFVGGFVFLSGALILIGSIAMTKFQRIYEAAVLKTLGAKRKVLLTILLAEYSLLGLVAGVIGSLAAVGLSYASSRYVFDVEWSFTPMLNFTGILATIVLVVIVGAISTLDVLAKKPLLVLRTQ